MFSPQRIFAMVLRYWYLLRSSWPRLAELIYWPLVQLLTWGFLQTYLATTTSDHMALGQTMASQNTTAMVKPEASTKARRISMQSTAGRKS